MIDYRSGVPGLGRQSVGKLLESLNQLRLKGQDSDPSSRPLISLHLYGGGQAEGWLLDLGPSETDATHESIVMLHRAWPDPRQPAEAVLYVALREIQAVTVFGAPAAARHLLPPLTQMDVRRLADETGQAISARAGKTIRMELGVEKVPEASLRDFAEQLQTVQAVLGTVLSDPLGRGVFHEKVRVLRIQAGPAIAARLEGETFQIILSAEEAASYDALKTVIEAAL